MDPAAVAVPRAFSRDRGPSNTDVPGPGPEGSPSSGRPQDGTSGPGTPSVDPGASPGDPKTISVGGRTFNLSDIHRGTGYHLSHVSRVFAGKRTPSMNCASAIAGYIGMSLDEFYALLNQVKAEYEAGDHPELHDEGGE